MALAGVAAERTSGSYCGDVRGCNGEQPLVVCGSYDALQHDGWEVFGAWHDAVRADVLVQVVALWLCRHAEQRGLCRRV